MAKKLVKDFHKLLRNIGQLTGGQARVTSWDEADLSSFKVLLEPNAGYYKGGSFNFKIEFIGDYPGTPPTVNCLSRIYHPNIDYGTENLDGESNVCFSMFESGEWNGEYGLEGCVLGLMFFLNNPNRDDAMGFYSFPQDDEELAAAIQDSINGKEVEGEYFTGPMFETGEENKNAETQEQEAGEEVTAGSQEQRTGEDCENVETLAQEGVEASEKSASQEQEAGEERENFGIREASEKVETQRQESREESRKASEKVETQEQETGEVSEKVQKQGQEAREESREGSEKVETQEQHRGETSEKVETQEQHRGETSEKVETKEQQRWEASEKVETLEQKAGDESKRVETREQVVGEVSQMMETQVQRVGEDSKRVELQGQEAAAESKEGEAQKPVAGDEVTVESQEQGAGETRKKGESEEPEKQNETEVKIGNVHQGATGDTVEVGKEQNANISKESNYTIGERGCSSLASTEESSELSTEESENHEENVATVETDKHQGYQCEVEEENSLFHNGGHDLVHDNECDKTDQKNVTVLRDRSENAELHTESPNIPGEFDHNENTSERNTFVDQTTIEVLIEKEAGLPCDCACVDNNLQQSTTTSEEKIEHPECAAPFKHRHDNTNELISPPGAQGHTRDVSEQDRDRDSLETIVLPYIDGSNEIDFEKLILTRIGVVED